MTVINLHHFTWKLSDKRGVYESLHVTVGTHRVEITASPTGRSVHVHVDGKRVLGGRGEDAS